MIVFEDVSLTFPKSGGHFCILDRVNVTFESGKSIGIIGHREVGKSAVMRLLAGGLAPTDGRVVREGSLSWQITSMRPMMGMLSVRSNLRFLAQLHRVYPPLLIERVQALSQAGDLIDERFHDLPRDMQSRISVSACLALEFDTYLADESLLIGDHEFRQRAKLVLDAILRRRSLIISTRHAAVLRRHCDAAFLLHGGALTYFPDVADAIAAFNAVAAPKLKTQQLQLA
jgi:capsular polysaccharide transport system ATP-binding protein